MAKKERGDAVSLDVYFDYLWPYVYNAAVWLQEVKEDTGHKLTVNWRYFSLEQVSNKQGWQWKIWEQAKDYPSRRVLAFKAAEAARQHGEVFFVSYHMALLKAKHEQGRDIADVDTLIELAREIGLKTAQFQKDLNDNSLLLRLAKDHTFAVETLGIFGTPTLVFPRGKPVFLKLASPPPPSKGLAVFNEIRRISEERQYIIEIKRP